ncbi:uncharacterized protein LOC144097270 isoform X1 [Amblyomma americanum]
MLSFHGLPLLALGVLQLCIAANLELGSRRYNQPESARSVGPNLFALFKDAVAVRDVNRDPKFKCLTATRIDLDANHSSATYRWSLNIVGVEKVKHPVVHWSSDTIPNILTGIVNSDITHPDYCVVLYSDSKACLVWEMHYFGHQCTLWVLSKYKDTVPQECLDKHAELCGKGVTLYDNDHCKETNV